MDFQTGDVGRTPGVLWYIEAAFYEQYPESPFTLKPVFHALGEQYSYGVLRCVRAGMIVRSDFLPSREALPGNRDKIGSTPGNSGQV